MSQTPQTPAGPGWYDDPQDPELLRYFDGIVWSSHTSPRRSPTAQASTIGRAPEVPAPGQAGWGQAGGQAPGQWPGQPGSPGLPGGWPGGAMPPAQYGGYQQGWPVPRTDVLPDGAVLAPWWRRLFARLLDWLVTAVITTVVAWPWIGDAVAIFSDFMSETIEAADSGGTPPSQAVFTERLFEVVGPITLISIAVALVYETVFLVARGATPGKMLLGTVVRRVAGPGRLTVLDALKRQAITVGTSLLGLVPLVSIFGSLLSVLDPAWLLWDPKRQALHDKVADTVVVLRNPHR